jgi:hypothetical protein
MKHIGPNLFMFIIFFMIFPFCKLSLWERSIQYDTKSDNKLFCSKFDIIFLLKFVKDILFLSKNNDK